MSQNQELWKWPCRICGAPVEWPCVPLTTTGYATVLRAHKERSWSPWQFDDLGYGTGADGRRIRPKRRHGSRAASMGGVGA